MIAAKEGRVIARRAVPCLLTLTLAAAAPTHAMTRARLVWSMSGLAPAAQAETDASGVYHGVGIVKAIQPKTGALTLDHEDIVGFMPAMEMMYKVKSPALANGLKVGDRVEFDVDAKTYTILGARRVGVAK